MLQHLPVVWQEVLLRKSPIRHQYGIVAERVGSAQNQRCLLIVVTSNAGQRVIENHKSSHISDDPHMSDGLGVVG